MHEVGLAYDIVEAVCALGRENGCSRISEVTLGVGECSGVMEEALLIGLESAAKSDRMMRHATFDIVEVPGKITCLSCGDVSGAATFSQPCPSCGSLDRKITAGRELEIVSMKAR